MHVSDGADLFGGFIASGTASDGLILSHAAFAVYLDPPAFSESHAPDGPSTPQRHDQDR